MEIIDGILQEWFNCEQNIIDNWRVCKNEHDDNINDSNQLADEVNLALENYENAEKMYRTVYDFMDYIGVNKELLPFHIMALDSEKIEEMEAEIHEIEEKDRGVYEQQLMYLRYYNILQAIRNHNTIRDILAIRKDTNLYITEYELYIDVFMLHSLALESISKTKYSLEHYMAYKEAIELFNVNNMISYGHPKQDLAFQDGKAELVMAICRISWELYYLENLADVIEQYHSMSNGRKAIKEIKKSERNNSVFNLWIRDISMADTANDELNVFLKAYKENITETLKQDIEYFIHQF